MRPWLYVNGTAALVFSLVYGCGSGGRSFDAGARGGEGGGGGWADAMPVVGGGEGGGSTVSQGGHSVSQAGQDAAAGSNDAAAGAPAELACASHSECDDGVFCNGSERCDAGVCAARSSPCSEEVCDEDAKACPEPVVDADGDGEPEDTDCDDGDPKRHPGATERCDDVDDDCDPATLGPDKDRDGAVGASCSNPQSEAEPLHGTDCDDANKAVSPEAHEICNAIDDDCDGSVDEPAPGHPLCSVPEQSCVSGECRCPAGQSLCGGACVSLGGSCSVGKGACLRTGVFACQGLEPGCSVTEGAPVVEVCDGVDNDCDGTVDEELKVSCNPDSDGDRYASDSSTTAVCADSARIAFGYCPVGYVAPSASLGTDCDASDPGTYRRELTSADADNDGRCAGVSSMTCVGVSAPSGRRFTSACIGPTDCDDGNASVYQTVSVRTDADRDGYCTGSEFQQCTSGGAVGSARLSSSCSGNDCSDGNANATLACSIGDGFVTKTVRKLCTIGPPPYETFGTEVETACPAGFSPANVRTQVNSSSLPGGNCVANGTSAVKVGCGGVILGAVDCRIVADCVAN